MSEYAVAVNLLYLTKVVPIGDEAENPISSVTD
jgi:hypothetical protein